MPLEGRVESLDLATLIPLAVVLARLVVPLFIGRVRRAVAAG